MNILVTGSDGQLGRALRRASVASSDRYFFTDVAGDDTLRLDITDADAVEGFVREHGIGVVVNCAAYTNVDRAEDDAARAELLNATAVKHLARSMKGVGGLLVHVSTDYVFGGDPYNTPCREEQKGSPTGVYGVTKLHGEEAIRSVGCPARDFPHGLALFGGREEFREDDAASDGGKRGAEGGFRSGRHSDLRRGPRRSDLYDPRRT